MKMQAYIHRDIQAYMYTNKRDWNSYRLFLSDDVIMEIGDSGTDMFFLEKGRVRVYVYQKMALKRKVVLQGPTHFGESAFFMGKGACMCEGTAV